MGPRDVFQLIARGVGLVFMGVGASDAFGSLFTALGFQSAKYYTAIDRGAASLAYLLSGVLVMVLAGMLANAFYGRKQG